MKTFSVPGLFVDLVPRTAIDAGKVGRKFCLKPHAETSSKNGGMLRDLLSLANLYTTRY